MPLVTETPAQVEPVWDLQKEVERLNTDLQNGKSVKKKKLDETSSKTMASFLEDEEGLEGGGGNFCEACGLESIELLRCGRYKLVVYCKCYWL